MAGLISPGSDLFRRPPEVDGQIRTEAFTPAYYADRTRQAPWFRRLNPTQILGLGLLAAVAVAAIAAWFLWSADTTSIQPTVQAPTPDVTTETGAVTAPSPAIPASRTPAASTRRPARVPASRASTGLRPPSAPASVAVTEIGLDRVRSLYVSAAYEDALALLAGPAPAATVDVADKYRALCLLALNRTPEAEEVLDRLLVRNPSFQMTQAEASPRVIALLADVRRRVLLRDLETRYAQARADYDAGRFRDAAVGFGQVVLTTSNPGVAGAPRVEDLRRLADEYRLLASARTDSPASTENVRTARALDPEPAGTRVFTRLDAAVHPPVELDRKMPAWSPPRDVAWRSFRGLIEVLVNERGAVDDARLIERIAPFYDGPLLASARTWRFKPASLNGLPVKFRQQLDIVMRPPR